MFHQLVSHNGDLGRLVDKGYAVGFDSGYLVVRDIPYLGPDLALRMGAIVTVLKFIDKLRVEQVDHQVYFAGEAPHGLDGRQIPNLGGGQATVQLSDGCADVVVQRSFSNKPTKTGRFTDFFEKIESYVAIISGPAIERHGATPYTFRVQRDVVQDSVFKFHDTLTTRAEIGDLSIKFRNDIVAVIGLGGTGAYVLDLVVKTPVREIRAFDLDAFHVHNAFRSPGRLEESELGRSKADVYRDRYDSFRHGLTIEPLFLDASSADRLENVTFAFVCVDKGPSRAVIFEQLLARQIPFIDVGMGLRRKEGALNGMIRTTYYSAEAGRRTRDMGLAELSEAPDDEYRKNIQIAELNALNACLAVIRYKQIRGFYHEDSSLTNLLLEISDLKLVSS